jgi:hypothetical protein
LHPRRYIACYRAEILKNEFCCFCLSCARFTWYHNSLKMFLVKEFVRKILEVGWKGKKFILNEPHSKNNLRLSPDSHHCLWYSCMQPQLMRKHAAPTSLFFVRDICTHRPRKSDSNRVNWKIIQNYFYASVMLCAICWLCGERNFISFSLLLSQRIVGVPNLYLYNNLRMINLKG